MVKEDLVRLERYRAWMHDFYPRDVAREAFVTIL
jgi:hypothetical protein